MGNEKQIQKAGDNSQQMQADTIIINNGISEERVREICLETSKKAIADCTTEATRVAEERVNQFSNILVPRIQQIESDFNSFSDPSFQVLLKKAQLSAACSGKDADYKILSELLIHRVKNKTDVKKKASISKAIEIIDKIDEDSLLGLTVFHSIESFVPTTGKIEQGIAKLDTFYSKYDLDDLPQNKLWLDNLSILNAIRVDYNASLVEFSEHLSSLLSGYVSTGIKKESESYKKAVALLEETRFKSNALIDHELITGYVRLPIVNIQSLKSIKINANFYAETQNGFPRPYSNEVTIDLTEQEINIFHLVIDLYDNNPSVNEKVYESFKHMLNSYRAINKISTWCDSFDFYIELTSIGKVIAHTNAKSIDHTLPDMD